MKESALTNVGCKAGQWAALVRRARIGRERKFVALTVHSYAGPDGDGIFCGVARLAVDCEIGYSTARRYLAWLREVGLVELVKPGNRRRGLSDEYRLVLGPDVLEHLDVPDPDAYKVMVDEVREANRRGSARRSARRRDPRPEGASADSPDLRSPDVAGNRGCPPDLRSPRASADDPISALPALSLGERRSRDLRSPGNRSALALGERPPSISTLPLSTTSHLNREDLRTAVTGPRAQNPKNRISASPPIAVPTAPATAVAVAEPPADPQPATTAPQRCASHNLRLDRTTRPDGRPRCPLCRVGAPPAATPQQADIPKHPGATP